ncbi:MAG: hypothetical protein KAV87_00280 [Desulfobacteraceae bacterium]|nr:hypothetical protein [Desulfobacteraceae bacterium]
MPCFNYECPQYNTSEPDGGNCQIIDRPSKEDCGELIEAPEDRAPHGQAGLPGSMPWNRTELNGWSIVGMNHYHQEGRKYLFCSMAKDGRCITAEGLSEDAVFDRLAEQA